MRGGVVMLMLGGMGTTNAERAGVRGPRRSQSCWTAEVARWRASGLDAPQYAQERGLKVARLLWWSTQLKLRRRKDASVRRTEAGPIAFLPLRTRQSRVESPTSEAACIEVVLANGRRVRIVGPVDVTLLGEVLTAAEGGNKC